MNQDRTRASLELLLNISRELATTLDLHTVLSRVLYLSVEHVEAERASLVVLDEALNPVDAAIVAMGRLHPHSVEQLQGIIAQGLAGWVLRNRQPAFVLDTSQDERWLLREDDQLDRSGPKCAICVPLSAQDQLVGILTIVHPIPGYFSEDHLTLVQAIADMAGIAVRNAQLYHSMQAAQRRYSELFEDSIDPIALTDRRGVIIDANRQLARFTESPLDELKGHTIMELHDVNWERVGASFEAVDSGNTISYEAAAQFNQGPNRPVEVYVRKVSVGDGDVLQWILRDITERKELDAMRDDLTAMIYHDLRSPLANIVSGLDILASMLPEEDNEAIQPVFQIAVRSTERLQRLISSLLDISRLEAGQPLAEKKLVLPVELARDAVEAMRPTAEGKQQKLTVDVPDHLPPILVDPDMIRRVLINLLENAAKFTPPRGELCLSGSQDEDGILLSVCDSGPGIPAEAHETIFEKYSRLKADNHPKGLGLGLAFCRLAVQAHGGRIWVEDHEPTGSRFVMRLPIQNSAG
ncbi:MAG TPA: ATP-binding protein [Anaerolineaceae bacterium]|nr:ATP-binding protein [Anaerolineaceae bacterium]